jgi:poly(glycerol-phosphate) alpha-glucosyltransferase
VDEDYRAEIDAIVRQAGPQGRVHLLDPAYGDARQAAYAGADAFILPSISEGLPIAVLEAFANGLPALLTTQCNLPEAFSKGCALEINADERAIGEGLSKLFAMPDDARLSMGRKARRFAAEKFDWDVVAARFAGIYSAVLAGEIGRR